MPPHLMKQLLRSVRYETANAFSVKEETLLNLTVLYLTFVMSSAKSTFFYFHRKG